MKYQALQIGANKMKVINESNGDMLKFLPYTPVFKA
jgi:hypothetical protein